jgi:hypothetical protein
LSWAGPPVFNDLLGSLVNIYFFERGFPERTGWSTPDLT